MARPLIKICGLNNLHLAVAAALAGADYIGLLFHPESPRHIEVAEAIIMAKIIRQKGAIPIAVFVNQSAIEMQSICEATEIQSVQLHGIIPKKSHHLLPYDYQRFYVQSAVNHPDEYLKHLDHDRDFILMDRPKTSSQKTINWKTFRYTLSFRWFLAGGLNRLNVQKAISLLHPDGVDVSSGVESKIGNKSIIDIQKFISAVGNHYAT